MRSHFVQDDKGGAATRGSGLYLSRLRRPNLRHKNFQRKAVKDFATLDASSLVGRIGCDRSPKNLPDAVRIALTRSRPCQQFFQLRLVTPTFSARLATC